MDLDERKKDILKNVVNHYIQTGEPVGSTAVVSMMGKAVSSATIRNEMAYLEKQGLLVQPHTSAGRIPTKLGYRYYVDNLMAKRKLTSKEQQSIDNALDFKASDPESLIEDFSKAVASFTSLASVLTMPVPSRAYIVKIQVMKIQKYSIFALLVTNNGIVKNKSIKTDAELMNEDVIVLNAFLNKNFCMIPIDELTPAAVQTMMMTLGEFALSLAPVVFSVYKMAGEITKSSVHIEGQSNLLFNNDVAYNVKGIFSILQSRQKILDILSKTCNDVNILIGEESDEYGFDGASAVLVKYKIANKPTGTIGIIGPERMDYSKMIPHMEYFAKTLGEFLNEFYE